MWAMPLTATLMGPPACPHSAAPEWLCHHPEAGRRHRITSFLHSYAHRGNCGIAVACATIAVAAQASCACGAPVTRLSVNVNKIATVRNSRGGSVPSVLEAAAVVAAAGAGGLTVHPRTDRRHITFEDVHAIADRFRDRWSDALEYNVEGDPQPEWLDLVCAVRPRQATLVPITPGEVTSSAGWVPDRHRHVLEPAVRRLRAAGIRVSLFVDPA